MSRSSINVKGEVMGLLKDKKAFLIFLCPALLFYLFSVFYPIVESLRMSFISWNGIQVKKFIGLQNYIDLFNDKVFGVAFVNNIVYLVIVVSMQLIIGLIVAILLTYVNKGTNLIKTLYYIPCIVTTIAITQLFRSIYSIEPMGLLNTILNSIGMGDSATSWISNTKTVLIAVSIPEGWRFIGLYMVIFYSALISLSPDISEAAIIDGVNKFQLLTRVKLPLIRPVIQMSLIMCLTGALRGFDIPFLLTNGGPGNMSELMSTYMYKKAFTSMQYGYGSSIAVFIVIESLLVVVFVNQLFRKNRDIGG